MTPIHRHLKTILLLLASTATVSAGDYDPLKVFHRVVVRDTEFSYGESSRTVPLRIYRPAARLAEGAADPAADGNALGSRPDGWPVVLFSHGLGGSREANRYLGNQWAGRGYFVVVMQHPGSDREVLRKAAPFNRYAALKNAANARAAADRFRDVKATLDHLAMRNRSSDGELSGKLNLSRVGMSGHSFGAVTTQAVSGQNYGRLGQVHTDARIKAAVAFSPSPPQFRADPDTFKKVRIPWLLVTGTEDNSPLGNRTDAAARREVFRELPASGQFYELVLDGADHAAFSDRQRIGKKRNPAHHQAIRAISTAFWDAYLQGEQPARDWLEGDGPKQILAATDTWARK